MYDRLSDVEPVQHQILIGRLKPQTVVDSLLTNLPTKLGHGLTVRPAKHTNPGTIHVALVRIISSGISNRYVTPKSDG